MNCRKKYFTIQFICTWFGPFALLTTVAKPIFSLNNNLILTNKCNGTLKCSEAFYKIRIRNFFCVCDVTFEILTIFYINIFKMRNFIRRETKILQSICYVLFLTQVIFKFTEETNKKVSSSSQKLIPFSQGWITLLLTISYTIRLRK